MRNGKITSKDLSNFVEYIAHMDEDGLILANHYLKVLRQKNGGPICKSDFLLLKVVIERRALTLSGKWRNHKKEPAWFRAMMGGETHPPVLKAECGHEGPACAIVGVIDGIWENI